MKPKCPDCGRALNPHCDNNQCCWWVCVRCAIYGTEDYWQDCINYGSKT